MTASDPPQPAPAAPMPDEAPPVEAALAARPDVGRKLASGAAWTLGGYGVAQVIRFATSMAVTRLLAPELFGIMLIVNTVRTGAELLSDIGIGQSVIRSPRGEEPAFYNTAWTLQVGRGLGLFLICALLAVPISAIYNIPELLQVLPVAGSTLLITGFTSMALPLLRRRMSFPRLAVFEVVTALLFSLFQIMVAYIYPTIWALVIGLIFGSLVVVVGSLGLENIKHRFLIDRDSVKEIFSFGKWITISSVIFFVTMNLDRIYFPAVISLEILGIFSIARTITDIVNTVFTRINNSVLFPHISSEADRPRHHLREEIASIRNKSVLVSGAAVGFLAASADLLVSALFDHRYHSAGWMASLLAVGTWFAILASTAEATLLGLGRPQTATLANSVKLGWLLASLPLAMSQYGMVAAIVAISASELIRYVATIPGQRRASISFLRQDIAATAIMFGMVGLAGLVRLGLSLPLLL